MPGRLGLGRRGAGLRGRLDAGHDIDAELALAQEPADDALGVLGRAEDDRVLPVPGRPPRAEAHSGADEEHGRDGHEPARGERRDLDLGEHPRDPPEHQGREAPLRGDGDDRGELLEAGVVPAPGRRAVRSRTTATTSQQRDRHRQQRDLVGEPVADRLERGGDRHGDEVARHQPAAQRSSRTLGPRAAAAAPASSRRAAGRERRGERDVRLDRCQRRDGGGGGMRRGAHRDDQHINAPCAPPSCKRPRGRFGPVGATRRVRRIRR